MTYWPAWVVGLLLIVVLPTVAVVAQLGIRRTWPSLAKGEHNVVLHPAAPSACRVPELGRSV